MLYVMYVMCDVCDSNWVKYWFRKYQKTEQEISNGHFDVNGDPIYIVIFQLKCAYISVSLTLRTHQQKPLT